MLVSKFIDEIEPRLCYFRVQVLLEAEAIGVEAEAIGVEAEAVDKIAASSSTSLLSTLSEYPSTD